jgi:hypothetical protein
MLRSGMCTQAQLESREFQAWGTRLGERPRHLHRKVWEFCFISQALHERGMLAPGRRGLGFAVGREPLPALFASLGCEIVATDLATEEAQAGGWVERGMHADSLEALNGRGLCEPALFRERASFRWLDMRALPPVTELGRFDFIWSACALEHLGSLQYGENFIFQALRYLRPGGVAVHTTEYNVSSNTSTITEGQSNIFRRRDLERIAADLGWLGYRVDLDFVDGDRPGDGMVDPPPYTGAVHLKLLLEGYVATSFGMIIEGVA